MRVHGHTVTVRIRSLFANNDNRNNVNDAVSNSWKSQQCCYSTFAHAYKVSFIDDSLFLFLCLWIRHIVFGIDCILFVCSASGACADIHCVQVRLLERFSLFIYSNLNVIILCGGWFLAYALPQSSELQRTNVVILTNWYLIRLCWI